MKIEGRIGVLGGTFDPIHNGHLDVVDAARRACALDTVLLVPARLPPHRAAAPLAPAAHRFAMAAMAAHARDDLRVSDIELREGGPSFTSVTLERLAAYGHRPEQLFFITGADTFADIASWHDIQPCWTAATSWLSPGRATPLPRSGHNPISGRGCAKRQALGGRTVNRCRSGWSMPPPAPSRRRCCAGA